MALRRMGRPGLIGTAARTAVVVGTAQAVTGKSAARQAAAAPPSPPPAAATAPTAQPVPAAPVEPVQDLTAQLERLAQLAASGMLTPEEFSAAKALLLA
jgi:hypothetical protein